MPDDTMAEVEDPLSGTDDAVVLDNAAWVSLTGPHAHFAEVHGQAARYPVDVSPFVAVSPDHDEGVWDDLAALVGPGGLAPLIGPASTPPAGWEVVGYGQGVQMVGVGVRSEVHPEIEELAVADVAKMLGLIERTRPGPFGTRTIELGRYLGIRRGGALVAMAGERLHPRGWTEISAVCTAADWRGQGFASALVKAVVAGIVERDERPFLHAAATNVNAIRLYHQLGFVIRRRSAFQAVKVPARYPPA